MNLDKILDDISEDEGDLEYDELDIQNNLNELLMKEDIEFEYISVVDPLKVSEEEIEEELNITKKEKKEEEKKDEPSILYLETFLNFPKDFGKVTFIKTHPKLIAFGTAQGIIIIYYDKKYFIIKGNDYITCLDVNVKGDFLITGHLNGKIRLWDIKEKKELKLIEEFKESIENIYFFKQKIIVGSKNEIKTITLSKLLFILYQIEDSIKIEHINFMGIEIFEKEYLIIGQEQQIGIYLLKSFKLIQILYKNIEISMNCLPIFDFKKKMIIVGYGKDVKLFKFKKNEFIEMVSLEIEGNIIGIKIHSEQVVYLLDSFQNILILDPFSMKIVEKLNKKIKIYFHERKILMKDKYHGIPRACYDGSIKMENGSLFLLGEKELYKCKIYNWMERIENLFLMNEKKKGYLLGVEFYKGKGFGIIDLSINSKKRKEEIQNFLKIWIQKEEIHQENIDFFIEILKDLDLNEMIKDEKIYKQKNFFSILEKHKNISLNQEMMDLMINYYIEKNQFEHLEDRIIENDIKGIDTEWLLLKCRKYRLYNAQFHIYNILKKDYISPLKTLYDLSKNGNKKFKEFLLNYLKRCFTSDHEYKQELLKYLLENLKYYIEMKEMYSIFEIVMNDYSIYSPFDQDLKRQYFIDKIIENLKQITLSFSIFIIPYLSKRIILLKKELIYEIFKIISESLIDIQDDFIIIMKQEELDENLILPICEKSLYYRICLKIYEKKEQQNIMKVLNCYLRDNKLKNEIFEFIIKLMNESKYLNELKNFIFDNLNYLIQLNSDKFIQIIINYYHQEHILIINSLEKYPKLLFKYLKSFKSLEMITSEDINYLYLNLLCQFEKENVLTFLKLQNNYDIDKCLLLCKQYNIPDAQSFLLERTGDIIQSLNTYLIHFDNKIQEIKKIFIQESKILDPKNKKTELKKNLVECKEYEDIHKDLMNLIQICQRSVLNIDQIWFNLIDYFVNYSRELKMGFIGKRMKSKLNDDQDNIEENINDHIEMLKRKLESKDQIQKDLAYENVPEKIIKLKEQSKQVENQIISIRKVLDQLRIEQQNLKEKEQLKLKDPLDPVNLPKLTNIWLQQFYFEFLKESFQSMIGYLDISVILDRIIKKYKKIEFIHLREVLLNIMEKIQYDKMIHHSINDLLNKDSYWLFTSFINIKSSGFKQKWKSCPFCNQNLEADIIKLFACGHIYHQKCLDLKLCPICYKQEFQFENKFKKIENSFISNTTPQGKIQKTLKMEKDLKNKITSLKNLNVTQENLLSLAPPSYIRPISRNIKMLPKSPYFNNHL